MGQGLDKNMMKYDVLVPIIKEDLSVFLHVLPFWLKYLPVKTVIFIGPKSIKDEVKKIEDFESKYIDEDTIIKLADIKMIISDYTNGDLKAVSRAGWYLQQFIKMQYALFCEDEYYLIWDSDTIPLHTVDMMSNNKPIFHMKDEHHQPYFDTIYKLLGTELQENKKSFISEHMLIKCSVMRELIETIELKDSIVGKTWYEKVLRSISTKDIMYSGFSEYETYGIFASTFYPGLYENRDWKSERRGHLFFDIESISWDDIRWVGKEYDALSFEKSINYNTRIRKILQYKITHIIKFTTYLKVMKLYDSISMYDGEAGKNE